jgi:hypothetical protein
MSSSRSVMECGSPLPLFAASRRELTYSNHAIK